MSWREKVIQASEWTQFAARLVMLAIWWIAVIIFLGILQLAGWALGRAKPKPPSMEKTEK